jgi:hypothetical protein
MCLSRERIDLARKIRYSSIRVDNNYQDELSIFY